MLYLSLSFFFITGAIADGKESRWFKKPLMLVNQNQIELKNHFQELRTRYNSMEDEEILKDLAEKYSTRLEFVRKLDASLAAELEASQPIKFFENLGKLKLLELLNSHSDKFKNIPQGATSLYSPNFEPQEGLLWPESYYKKWSKCLCQRAQTSGCDYYNSTDDLSVFWPVQD